MFTKNRLDDVGVIIVYDPPPLRRDDSSYESRVLLCLTTIFFSLDRVSAPMQAMSKASLAACEFFCVIDTPVTGKGSLKAPRVAATDDIVFENVTFAYPSRPDVKVLDQLNLCIEAGRITAIVGPSGSGKSTIVGLIERWYTLTDQPIIARIQQDGKDSKKGLEDAADQGKDKEVRDPVKLEGTITTSGHFLDDIDMKWWRSRIGLVQQEPFLFNDTIYENVARGLIGSRWEGEPEQRKRELVKTACQEAFADEFIDKLPLVGVSTYV